MKALKQRLIITGALFALLWTAQVASAWYSPNLQRWVNRDPIQESGGINLYAFVGNVPISSYDPDGLLPPSNPACQALKKKIENLEKEIAKRRGELHEDPLSLPESAPGDDNKPSLSRRGHRKILNMMKANLAAKKALYQAMCGDPEQPIKQCLLDAAESIPGTPQQLERAGDIAADIAVVTQAVIVGIETVGGCGGTGPLTVPRGKPAPCPAPAPAPSPFPVPAYP